MESLSAVQEITPCANEHFKCMTLIIHKLIFVSQAPLVHASKPPTPRLVCRSSLSSRAAQAAPATAPCSDHVSRSTVDIHGNLARVLSTEQPDTVSPTE